jgi:hypothetical protein
MAGEMPVAQQGPVIAQGLSQQVMRIHQRPQFIIAVPYLQRRLLLHR